MFGCAPCDLIEKWGLNRSEFVINVIIASHLADFERQDLQSGYTRNNPCSPTPVSPTPVSPTLDQKVAFRLLLQNGLKFINYNIQQYNI